MKDEVSDITAILEQATSIDIKKVPRSVKPDPGGLKTKRENKEIIEAATKAIVPRVFRASQKAYENLEGAAGGRLSLIETLKFCPESSAAHKNIQKLLVDAAVADVNTSIGALCFKNRVRFESIVLAFKDALTAKLAVEALTRLAENSDAVFEQVSSHALDRYDHCPVCEGKKRVRRIGDNGEWAVDAEGLHLTQLCYNCRGSGKIFKEHDVADRKLYLEIIGIIERKGISVNNIQQNASIGGSFLPGDGSFERLIKAVDGAVAPKSAAADEEIIDCELVQYESPSDPV